MHNTRILGNDMDRIQTWLKRLSPEAKEKVDLGRHFIKCYLSARQGLVQLGILRSERNLQGDYAEWLASQVLGLELVSSGSQRGYDAVDSQGRTYQIKSRMVPSINKTTSFDFQNIDFRFDYLIGVFLSTEFELLGIIRVAYDSVREMGSQTTTTFRFRWNRKVAGDPRVEWVWRGEEKSRKRDAP